MNFNNFTIKAQEAVQKAQEIASSNQQQFIEPSHLLRALFLVDEHVTPYLLQKFNVKIEQINKVLDAMIKHFPKVSTDQIYLSKTCNALFTKAQLPSLLTLITSNEYSLPARTETFFLYI